MANPFIVNQYLPQETFRGHGAQLGGIGSAIAQERARGEKEQQAQARNAQMQEEFKGVMSSNDPKQVAGFLFKYPEAAKQAKESFGIANDETERLATMGYGKALQSGNAEGAANQLEMYADQVEAEGGQPDTMRRDVLGLRDGSIDMNKLEMGVAFAKNELWQKFDEFNKSKELDDNKDLPAEAVAFNDLIKDFSPKEKITAKRIKAGLKGRAMSNAVLSAIESGDIKNLSQAKAEIKQAEKFAEMTGTSRAKTIDKGFETITKISSGINNIDRAIAAIDKGAGVGAVEKLWPSIKAASVELDNIRGQMALDVVGATTFGALSKGELDLAKDIALPTGLDTDELKVYLQEKKAAQEKLKTYYNEQIQFLDQGGTVAGFLRGKERGSQQQQPAQAQDVNKQALDWANANPDDPRSAQILQKLGG